MTLRAAWDLVDIGDYQISVLKNIAKVCYLLHLLLGIAIVCVTVLGKEIDSSVKEVTIAGSGTTMMGSQLVTFCLSLLMALVAALQAFYNPVRRWQQVRSATGDMASVIWQYRTRTGDFSEREGPSSCTRALAAEVRKYNDIVTVSANVQETNYNKFYGSNIFKHGQRPSAGTNKVKRRRVSPDTALRQANSTSAFDPEDPEVQELVTRDTHYRPMTPDDYVSLRLLTMLRFYRSRLPRYARSLSLGTWTILVASSVGALVAFLGFAAHVAIISSASAAIAAWMEFRSTAQKVSRYNAIIVSLKNILLWWDSMSQVDRASPVNIDLLVQMGEATLNAERDAWMSAGKPKGENEGAQTKSNQHPDGLSG